MIDNLSIEEKIGQLFLVGITNKECIPKVLDLIKYNYIGGVILYKNNYLDHTEMISLVKRLKDANKDNKVPLFIAIDQEGGRVNRFSAEFERIRNPYVFRNEKSNIIRKRINIMARVLASAGINMNFDPVLDLKLQKDTHAIGNRAYSGDPEKVSKISSIVVDEYLKNKIIPVVKHFPGQGRLKRDSHFLLPVIRDYKSILKSDILPFENAIYNDIPGIMVGHIKIYNKTNNKPASISKNFIKKELRKRLNYNNLVITDELSMRSVRYRYGKRRSIIKAIEADNDLITYKYFYNMENIFLYIKKLIKKNKLNLDNQVKRVLFIKDKYNISDDTNFIKINKLAINKEIRELNKLVEK